MKKVFVTVLATLIVLVAGFLIYIYAGAYNIAASEPHTDLGRWTFNTVMVQSVESHAENIEVPSLTDSSMVAAGFRAFDEMCVNCHGESGGHDHQHGSSENRQETAHTHPDGHAHEH